jgi:hypothetical protein
VEGGPKNHIKFLKYCLTFLILHKLIHKKYRTSIGIDIQGIYGKQGGGASGILAIGATGHI